MAETYYAKPDNSPVNDLTLNSYDALIITNGGTANGTIINSDGAATVNDGGSANNTTVNEGGTLHLIGGAATGISVASDGRLEVNKGATATGIEAEKGATLVFDVAASTHIAGTSDGAAFQIQNGIATGFTLETGVLTVSSGGTAVNATLNSAGFVTVYSGGTALNAVANANGEIKAFSGGTATGATIKTGGKLTVESSGFSDDATIEAGGNLYVVSSGGTAAGTYIGAMGNLAVSKGGTAYGTTVGAGGFLTVGTKGIADGADVNGFLNVLEGGLASNVTVNEGAVVYVQSKGTGSDVYVDYGGILEVLSDGRLKGATVAQGGSATIHADVMASNVVIDGGKVTVMSDGWAYQSGVSSNTIVRNGGRLVVSGGGFVVGAAVSAGGHVTVESDATFSSATVVAADVTALDGACVSRLNLEAGGILNVVSGGKAEHINVSAGGVLTGVLREASELKFYGGTLDLNIAGVSPDSEALVDEISFLSIMPVAEDYLCTLTVSDTQAEGAYKLIEGASGFDTSKAITVKDTLGTTLGTLTVNGGSTTIGGVNYTLAVTTEDVLTVTIAGGVDLTGDLNSDFELNAGMVGSSVNILEGGRLIVDGGGSADVVTVNFGGLLYVYNGGKATQIKENGGYVGENDGADVTFVSNSFGGYVYDSPDEWATIHSGTTGTDLTVGNDGVILVYSGGTAVDTTVAADGNLGVGDGGKLTGKVTIETGANVTVEDGAIVDFDLTKTTAGDPALVNDLSFFGTAAVNYTLTVDGTEADGDYKLAEGATGFDKTITVKDTLGTTLGTLTVAGGKTTIDGKDYTLTLTGTGSLGVTLGDGGGITPDITGDLATYYSLAAGKVGSSVNILDGGRLNVSNGGFASQTTVNSGGDLYVSAGGSADVVTVNFGGDLWVSNGATATLVKENGGYVYIDGGATATFVSNSFGGYVYNNADDWCTIHDGTTGTDLTVGNKGRIYVYSGGIASDTTVNDKGIVEGNSGGLIDGVVVNSGGSLLIYNGAKLTGQMTVVAGAEVIPFVGSILDFDLTQTAPDAAALVNDLSILMGTPGYTLTVDGTQASGTYNLAGNATGFSKAISVRNTSGVDYGYLTFGGTLSTSFANFTLNLTADNTLTVNVAAKGGSDTTPPTVTNIKASTTEPTNQNVTVTADFNDNVGLKSKLYQIDGGAWQDYTAGGVVMTKSGTVYFMAVDTSDNESAMWGITVDNIDKVAPTITGITPSTTAPAKSVTVTATFADDWALASRQYKIGDGAWTDYVDGVTVTENGTVYFKAVDIAGNEVEDEYNVTNIDSSAPEKGLAEPLNDWLFNKKDKTDPVNTALTNSVGTKLAASADPIQIYFDSTPSGTLNNFVGMVPEEGGSVTLDELDYAKVVLAHGAELSFSIDYTDAAKFTVWQLVPDKKTAGAYSSAKSIQATTLKNKTATLITGSGTKPIRLEAGSYYLSMQSTNAKKGGQNEYNVTATGTFFDDGDNSDDWTNMKTVGYGPGAEIDDLGVITDETLYLISGEWVGFGDAVDYKKFTLTKAAELSFAFSKQGADTLKFTVCQLKSTEKKGVVTYSQGWNKAATVKGKDVVGNLNDLLLEAGEYYIKVENTNAKKSNGTGYAVMVSESDFYTDCDSHANDYDSKAKSVSAAVGGYTAKLAVGALQIDGTLVADAGLDINHDGYTNFVGFGDASDIVKINAVAGDTLSLKVEATDAVSLKLYGLKNGKVTSIKSVKSKNGAATIDNFTFQEKNGAEFFVGVEATNAKKGEKAWYNVEVVSFSAAPAAALTMPETSDSLAMTDSLSFGNYGADALADASAVSSLAELDGKSAWQSLLA